MPEQRAADYLKYFNCFYNGKNGPRSSSLEPSKTSGNNKPNRHNCYVDIGHLIDKTKIT